MKFDQKKQELLDDLEYIFKLSISYHQLSNAIRAKELMAKVMGILVAGPRDKNRNVHLDQLSNEAISLLIKEAGELCESDLIQKEEPKEITPYRPNHTLDNNGAPEENRTPTPSPETDFESAASTSSATGAT